MHFATPNHTTASSRRKIDRRKIKDRKLTNYKRTNRPQWLGKPGRFKMNTEHFKRNGLMIFSLSIMEPAHFVLFVRRQSVVLNEQI